MRDDRPPFIRDQRLFQLKNVPVEQQLEWIKHFSLKHRIDAEQSKGRREDPEPEPPQGWQYMPDRTSFLIDPRIRLLLCTQNAGMGKTTLLNSLCYFRMASDPGHICIKVEFADLPTEVSGYLGRSGNSMLVQQFSNVTGVSTDNGVASSILITRKIIQGNFTLCIDATDQTNLTGNDEVAQDTIDRARSLAVFINQNPTSRIVLTGRPLSIITLWDHLFKQTSHDRWEIVQIDEFTDEEAERFIGKDRIEKLKQCEAELLSIPRSLETIRMLSPTELRGVRTASEIYWICVDKMLQRARNRQLTNLHLERIRFLLSVIAFEQIRLGQYGGTRPDSRDFRVLIHQIWDNHKTWLINEWEYESRESFKDDLGRLNSLNVALDPGIFTDPPNLQQTEVEHLQFSNRTLQSFFAALFVTRFQGQPKWLQNHLYLRGARGDHYQEEERYEFWKLACDMPIAARENTHYCQSISALYVPHQPYERSALLGSQIQRSTEMIHRSWWQLLEISNEEVYSDESDMMNATRALQRQVRTEFAGGNLKFTPDQKLSLDSNDAAKTMTQQYLLEFLALVDGQLGTKIQQELAREFDRQTTLENDGNGFLKIPTGEYWFGNPAKIQTQSKPFWLSRFPITNELIRLFDPSHGLNLEGKTNSKRMRFPKYSEHSNDPKCPAIFVDFHTAFCCSLFLGGELPNEFQWERSCRGNQNVKTAQATKYYSGDNESDLDLAAYFWGNLGSDGRGDRTRPLGVDTDNKIANNFGLKHMHGSVNEWTSSLYSVESKNNRAVSRLRVARGGSFNYLDLNCRSAVRDGRVSAHSDLNFGFRVLRNYDFNPIGSHQKS